jgi:hypothetical protein
MIIPLADENLYFDWTTALLDGKEVPFQVLVIDMELKKEIFTTAEELDNFCRQWNNNNPLKKFRLFTDIVLYEENKIEAVAEIRSILKTFWYLQPVGVILEYGTTRLEQKGPGLW